MRERRYAPLGVTTDLDTRLIAAEASLGAINDPLELGTLTQTDTYAFINRTHATSPVLHVVQAGAGAIAEFGKGTIGSTTKSPTITFGNDASITIESSTGDAALYLKADTDNNNETDNPFIRMEQDAAAVNYIVGITGGTGIDAEGSTFTGGLNNYVTHHSTYASGGIQWGTAGTRHMYMDSTGLLVNSTEVQAPVLKGTAAVSGTTNSLVLEATAPGLWLYETDATTANRGWKIYASAGSLEHYTTTDAGASTGRYMRVERTGTTVDAVALYAGGHRCFDTQDQDATGNTSGANIHDHSGNDHDVGFNDLRTQHSNSSITLDATDCGQAYRKTTTTARTITLPGSGDTDFPVGGVYTVTNQATSGNITINASTNSATLYWLDGSTRQGGASTNRTVGPGGVATIWRVSTTTWNIWGGGVS